MTAIQPSEPRELAPVATTNAIELMMQAAIEKNIPVETLKELTDLYERMRANNARQLWNAAFAAFKAECPPVPRRTESAQFKVTRNGVTRNRMYASLEDIEATVREPLGRHGLSYKWGDLVLGDGSVSMACIVAHSGGHSESSAVTMPTENNAGCSPQQKMGIIATYAQRYSLIAALGLTSCDEDADGNTPKAPANEPTITEHEADNLDSALNDLGPDRKAAFLTAYKIERLIDLPASLLKQAHAAIEAKRRKVGGK
jgi:hypothetical protein